MLHPPWSFFPFRPRSKEWRVVRVCRPVPRDLPPALAYRASLPSLDPRDEVGEGGERLLLSGTQDSRTFLDGPRTPALFPSHLRLEVTNRALPTCSSSFIFKRSKRGSVGRRPPPCQEFSSPLRDGGEATLRLSPWSVEAQRCHGHTVVQSWPTCTIISERHRHHESTRPVVGPAREKRKPLWSHAARPHIPVR